MTEAVSLHNMEVIESKKEEEPQKINFESKLEFLSQKYYFHEIIKKSPKTSHYIVEDIEIDPSLIANPEDHIFYLKQSIFDNREEYLNALQYYNKLLNYCKTPFAKTDIVKLKYIYDLDLEVVNYYEIVIVCDYGESDRINVAQIQRSHINNFLKNLCLLLEDLKKIQNIYHGNIFLKNIILVNGELKLSGFNPIFLKSKEKTWINEIAKKFGVFRLDLFLIGLLWLRFLNYDIDNMIKEEFTLEEVSKKIAEITKSWKKEKTFDIVKKLLNLKENKDLDLAIVIRDFDEHFILEKIQIEVDDAPNSFSGFRNSIDTRHSKQQSFTSENPFLKSYNETDIKEAKKNNIHLDPENDIIQMDEFSLKDKDSIRDIQNTNKGVLSPTKKNTFFKNIVDNRRSTDYNNTNSKDFDKMKSESERQILGDDINVKFSFDAGENFKKLIPKGVFDEDNTLNGVNVIVIDNRTYNNPLQKVAENIGKKVDQTKKNKNNNDQKKRFAKKNNPEIGNDNTINEEDKLKKKQEIQEKIQERIKNSSQNIDTSKKPLKLDLQNKNKKSPPKTKSKSPIKVESKSKDVKTEKKEKKINNVSEKPNYIYHKPKPQKKQKPTFDKLTKKLKNTFDISSFSERDKMFSYNHDLNNKNIPFKKVLQKGVKKLAEQKESFEELPDVPDEKTEILMDKNFNKDTSLPLTVSNNLKELNQTGNVSLLGDASFLDMVQIKDNLYGKKELPDINMEYLKAIARKLRRKIEEGVDEDLELKKKEEQKRKTQGIDLAAKIEKYQNDQRVKDGESVNSKKSRGNSVNSKKSRSSRKSSVFEGRKSSISKINKNKEKTINKTNNQNQKKTSNKKEEPEEIPENIPEYDEGIDMLQNLLNEGKYSEGLDLLGMMALKYEGVRKIKIFKMMAMIAYKKQDYCKAIKHLNLGIEYIENSDVYPKGKISANFLCHLSTCYLEAGNFEDALNCLFHKTFKVPENCSLNYYVLLGDCNKACKNIQAARTSYDIPLEIYLHSEMTDENKTKLFMMINRIFSLYLDYECHDELAKFFDYMIPKVKGIVKVNKTIADTDPFKMILFLFHVLDRVKEKKNVHFMNYLLSYIKDKKVINLNNISEKEKERLSTYFFDFCLYLKDLENFGGQKNLYLQYLLHSLYILEKINSNFENDKKKLMILFQLGNYHLSDKEYHLAKLDYQRCLEIYNKNYENPQQELFDVLFNIGTCLYKMKNYEEALYFLEQLNFYDMENLDLKNKTVKILVKIYYILKNHKKSKDLLQNWFALNINPKKENNFFKYFAFYNISSLKSKSDMEKFLSHMKNSIENLQNTKNAHYYSFFHNVFYIHFKKNNSNENLELLKEMNLIRKTKNGKLKAQRFVSLFSYLYSKLVLNLKKRSNDNIYETVEAFLDKNKNRKSELNNLRKFFRIMFLFLINFLNNQCDQNETKEDREDILANFNHFKNDIELETILFDAINKDKKVLDKDKTFKSNLNTSYLDKDFDITNRGVLVKNIVKKKIKDALIKNSEKKKVSENKSEISPKEISHWNFTDKTLCKCSHVTKNKELLELVEEFMKQIKNMLFLNLKDKILEYYDALKNIMLEKKFDFDKFDYLPLLINFNADNEKSAYFNKKKFYGVMDQICQKNICIHDFEIIFMFMESFNNVNFLESLVLYLHEKQPQASQQIFKLFLLDNFNNKYKQLTNELVKIIENLKYYLIENSPLVHHFENEKILKLDKKLTFGFFQRFRYYSMIKKENEELFLNYFTEQEMLKLKIRFSLYNSLVNLVRKDLDHLEIIHQFKDEIVGLLNKNDFSVFEEDVFLLDMLTIFNLISFKKNPEELAELIISLLKHVKERISENLFANLAFVMSHIGNVFFKNSLYKYVKIIKMIASDILNESKLGVNFTENWQNEYLRETNYDIESYIFMNNFVLKRTPEMNISFNKLQKLEPQHEIYVVEKKFLNLHYLSYHKKKDEFDKEADECITFINKMEGFKRDFYQAVYDKLLLNNSENLTEKEIDDRRRLSRNSMQKVYEDLNIHN